MNIEALRGLLNHQPFEPLRIKTSSGDVFEVRYPEIAALSRNVMLVVLPNVDGSPSDKFEYISYLHIASVETVADQRAA